MKEIIEKISSYNLFNYLLPGTVYVGVIRKTTKIDVLDDDILVTAFLCYFIGMIISRVGSLLIEPLLRQTGFLKFKEYEDYIEASKRDEKINTLSEQNNTFRSITAMTILIAITIPYDSLRNYYDSLQLWDVWVLITGVLVLFLFSYRKQTKFIVRRIEKNLGRD